MANQRTWEQYFHELLGRPELEYLRKELNRVTEEIARLDLQKHLSPKAKQKIKVVEARYHEVVKKLGKLQDQIDDEFKIAVKKLKTTRNTVESTFDKVQKTATSQKKNLEKLSTDLSKRLKKLAQTGTRKATKKTSKRTKH